MGSFALPNGDSLPKEVIRAIQNGASLEDRTCLWCRGTGELWTWGEDKNGNCPLCGGCGKIYVLRGPEKEGS